MDIVSYELKEQLEQKVNEAEYYKRLAKMAGDARLRETEELSTLTYALTEKIQIIMRQRKELEKLNQKIERISVTDELTNLLNRRGFMMLSRKEFQYYTRKNYDRKKNVNKFVCAMLDIDFFKEINDSFGHFAGDMILQELGDILTKSGILRAIDIVGRYGGDEFIIIFPGCEEKTSILPLEKLRQEIINRKIKIGNDRLISITVSIGVAELLKEDNDIEDVIKRADIALYHVKGNGRNGIKLFSELL